MSEYKPILPPAVQLTTQPQVLQYGSANLTGEVYEDRVCFAEDRCLHNFPIFALSN